MCHKEDACLYKGGAIFHLLILSFENLFEFDFSVQQRCVAGL